MRQLPTKDLLPIDYVVQVKRTGIRTRQLPSLAQNCSQQNGMVALGGKRDAHFAHFAQLARAIGELLLELIGADFLIEKLVRALDGIQQRRR